MSGKTIETVKVELLPPGVPCPEWDKGGHFDSCPREDTSVWRFTIRNGRRYVSYRSMTKKATEASTRRASNRELAEQVMKGYCL